MKARQCLPTVLATAFAVVLLGGCATVPYGPGPYYTIETPPAASNPAPAENEADSLAVGPDDRTYVIHVENNTPFPARRLPQARRVLYEKGFDQVRREREADFSLDISLTSESRDNPDLRGEHLLGGAILGAATGALLGAAAAGRPALGAAVGAAGGSFLGLAAPANTPVVRIDVRTQSFRAGTASTRSAVVDVAHVPPYDVPRVIDIQVSRMLQTLPAR
ncbi:MAG TPA: hypothetical protein VEF34_16695 [Syntrophobacteraceae bacterium]|nr:hypothetical protein [Syntrophobacteraceae bacterium]